MQPKLFSVRIANELPTVCAVTVYFKAAEGEDRDEETHTLPVNVAHVFEERENLFVDNIEVVTEGNTYTFSGPYLNHDSERETFFIVLSKHGVELRIRDKELKTKYDYSEVIGPSSTDNKDVIGY
ncbi:hypothetical protein C9374_007910 [Naegleria lovaniensis]|uniref:Uncharacterized protein n=1 Tax=Naegleria lovaniensis TaxID=51637 RepID=A0AA88KFY7_NAELO|nr:uncharacterized protein C9374_007910 [Naegleria lovaniensis]KAG2378762.1 hypothetical protein C9374_007910 [Naegleria lovaniensis]